MTLDWMATIAAVRAFDRPVFFEGQMSLAFVREGLLLAGIADARFVLVDYDDETRTHRLPARNQSELASPTVMNWAAVLRYEAQAGGYVVLDTSKISLLASVEHVRAHLRESL